METLQIVHTKYRPWQELITVAVDEFGASVRGSELATLEPHQILRIVRHDEAPRVVGAMLYGWWGEHALAADVVSGVEPETILDEAKNLYAFKDRVRAQSWFAEWIDNLEMGDAAEACDYCMVDEIDSLIPRTHTWGILNGWHSVYPKSLNDE